MLADWFPLYGPDKELLARTAFPGGRDLKKQGNDRDCNGL